MPIISRSETSPREATRKLYLIGSLRNKRIPILAHQLRRAMPDVVVFDDWHAAGPEADDRWKEYEQERGRTYAEALEGDAACHVFDFDKSHLDSSTHTLLVLPAGKSGHMEAMYAQYGAGSQTAILLDPDDDPRFDVMYKFIPTILCHDEEIEAWINKTGRGQLKLNADYESVTLTESQQEHPEVNWMQESRRLSGGFSVISPERSKKSRKSRSSEPVSICGTDGKVSQMVSADILKLGQDMF